MKYCLIVLMTLMSLAATAQDTIYYKQLPPNIVHVTVITPTKIHFTHIDEQEGPVYHVHIRDVAKVVSAKGTTLFYDEPNWEAGGKAAAENKATTLINIRKDYPKNLFSIIPIASIAAGSASSGISYERILGRNGRFAIRIPAFVTTREVSGYLMPALRIYPFGHRKGTIFISPGLFTAYGTRTIRRDSLRDVNGYYGAYNEVVTDWQFGFLLDAGLNLHMNEHFFINLTMGGALNYLDLTKGGDYIYPETGKIELGFGYRFDKLKK